jgi:hypothetical protein
LQDDAGLNVGTEPLQRCFESIRTGRKIRQNVSAASVGDVASYETRVGLGSRHGDTGQHGITFIRHPAAQLRCRQLRQRNRAGKKKAE